MAHPLDGAVARIKRADAHLDELKSLIEKFRKANEDEIRSQHQLEALALKPGQKVDIVLKNQPLVEIPLDFAIIVGEAVYNLRSALDYLVYELARKDSGSEKSGTQFPIEDVRADALNVKRGFEARRKTYLTGLNDRHIIMIERLQPYNGVGWTETLREISNPDKHRRLTAVNGRWGENATIEAWPAGVLDDGPGIILPGVRGIHPENSVGLQYTVDIVLANGSPLLETLEDLKTRVFKAIESFKPEF